jgi:NAD+ synthase
VGISGGVDSALVANIASMQKNIKVLGVWMNIDNSPLDNHCVQALKLQNRFSIIDVDLTKDFEHLVKTLKITNKLAVANLKARLRMTTLYALAQQHNLLVAGTSNADEAYIGYFTKYGDGAADILPIINLIKSDVFTAASLLKIPQCIIEREPSAGLYQGQTDEKDMGITYVQIDKFLTGAKSETLARNRIQQFHANNLHKLMLAPKPKSFRKLRT